MVSSSSWSVIRTLMGPPAHGSSIASSACVTNKLVFLLLWVEEPPFMTRADSGLNQNPCERREELPAIRLGRSHSRKEPSQLKRRKTQRPPVAVSVKGTLPTSSSCCLLAQVPYNAQVLTFPPLKSWQTL